MQSLIACPKLCQSHSPLSLCCFLSSLLSQLFQDLVPSALQEEARERRRQSRGVATAEAAPNPVPLVPTAPASAPRNDQSSPAHRVSLAAASASQLGSQSHVALRGASAEDDGDSSEDEIVFGRADSASLNGTGIGSGDGARRTGSTRSRPSLVDSDAPTPTQPKRADRQDARNRSSGNEATPPQPAAAQRILNRASHFHSPNYNLDGERGLLDDD